MGEMNKEVRMLPVKRTHREHGSALLVVLVFAAIIGIMLYRELPIAAFEAQRQKEQLLVSRGNEYKRGVKLFVRKIGRFPSTLDELENTNRMRFLRHRFVDPLTGKDDWRLIHAGPGGVITDSKVATNTNNKNAGALGQGATFAGFNNSFSGDTTAAAAADNTPSAGLRQRPPATKNAANGTGDPLAGVSGQNNPTDPNNPTPGVPGGSANLDPVTGQSLAANATQGSANAPTANNTIQNQVNTLADQLNTINPRTPDQGNNPFPGLSPNGLSPAPAASTTASTTSSPSQTPTTGLGNTSTFGSPQNGVAGNQGSNQAIGGAGGIAGVASKAEGKGIKLVHDQKKYNLWEFYYDMRAEQQANAGSALGQTPGANGANGIQNTNGTNTSAFGNSNNSAFGGSGSSFGSSPNQPASNTLPTTPQSQP